MSKREFFAFQEDRLSEEDIMSIQSDGVNRYVKLCVQLHTLAKYQGDALQFYEVPYMTDLMRKDNFDSKELNFTVYRPGKYLFFVEDEESAIRLSSQIQQLLDNLNKNITTEDRKKLYLKVKVFHGGDLVRLSVADAFVSRKTDLGSFKRLLEKTITKAKDDLKELQLLAAGDKSYTGEIGRRVSVVSFYDELYKDFIEKIEGIDLSTPIRVSTQGASLWRLTYWDLDELRRKQIAFGDVVILRGDKSVKFSHSAMQKKRTDVRENDPNLLFEGDTFTDKKFYILKI